MTELALARWQFAITSVYHFFFVPLTLGLSILVALMETRYVQTGNDVYKRMTKFWGKLFLINFAMGVVTGIVMEFQFGMNWSDYSRFVGDIFGVPLAIEALLAFFLESTFLGLWIFGWDRLSPKLHLMTIWLVAIGSNVSAFWILAANSWMQQPVGFALEGGRAVLTDFVALITNPNLWVQFPHVVTGGLVTAAFFVLGISAFNLRRLSGESPLFRRSFRWGAVAAMIAVPLVGLIGHAQGQHMVKVQPMKMAAAEGLWESENPASFSLFTISDEAERRDIFTVRIPYLLSIMAYNTLDGEVLGINNLQAAYEERYGPGNYVPPVAVSYWSFRLMVGAAFLMLAVAGLALYLVARDRIEHTKWFFRFIPWAIGLPYIANSSGWILTEMGRQPWIVFGLQLTEEGVSPTVALGWIALSLVIYTLVYAALIVVDVYLLARFARVESPTLEASAPASA
jgi:cytochrome d ubiquinol oxidase subunit I